MYPDVSGPSWTTFGPGVWGSAIWVGAEGKGAPFSPAADSLSNFCCSWTELTAVVTVRAVFDQGRIQIVSSLTNDKLPLAYQGTFFL